MSLISNWFRSTIGRTNRAAFALLVMILAILPSAALASGAEASVKLDFTASDMNYLYASGVMGLIAIVYGFMIRAKLLKQSPGDEAMQSVGGAIREGAMAYLKKQFSTMLIFVVIVAVALFAAYQGT
ncbi:MAG: sodium/proton-translocating pyrophosphatase, partial [Armatimonadetes bacterium]|nr:sodium/proton-translocating pyrophosphatase [Armatimonadota bacterium]